jgi:two-component system, chemotaxis family, chemotaxis protein CheY
MTDFRSVLVVDDSAATRAYLAATLEGEGGYRVTQAENGFEALRLLPKKHFDLVISDVNMPDINGLELVRFLRESPHHKRTPVVLVTTDNRPADRERGERLGASAYLTKPFTPEELLRITQELIQAAEAAE